MQLCLSDHEGTASLKGIIKSIKDFYAGIFDTNLELDCEPRIHSSMQIRAELFKINYATN